MVFFRKKSGGQRHGLIASLSMKLFHGTEYYFDTPDTKHSVGKTDFGSGFYTTSDEWFAIKYIAHIREAKKYVIIEYEFDDEQALADGLKIIRFKKDADWARFIMANRTEDADLLQEWGDYDVAIGPSADDEIDDVVEYYVRSVATGSVDWDEIIKMLKPDEYGEQVLFHTDRSVDKKYLEEKHYEHYPRRKKGM